MARPRDSAEIKATKIEATRTFVRFVETHCVARGLRPRDFEELLSIGGELKNGIIWNAYARGARAMQPDTLRQKIALAAHKKLLSKEVAAHLTHAVDARLAYARLAASRTDRSDESVELPEAWEFEGVARWRAAVQDVMHLSIQAELLLTKSDIHALLQPIVAWAARLEKDLAASKREQDDLCDFYMRMGEDAAG